MVSYCLYRVASALVSVLPRSWSARIATWIAFLFFIFKPAIRRNVRLNFERLGMSGTATFPVFKNFSHAVTDLLRLIHMNSDQMRALCTVRGTDNLDAALKKGRGAILFAPHLGPWEIGGAFISSLGYAMHTVALEHPSSRVTGFFSMMRKRWGFADYPLRSCAVGLMKALERGETVVLLVDRNFSHRGTRFHFLGSEVLLPDGHITLALRSGAALLPSFSYYSAEGGIQVVIGEEIPVGDRDSSNAAIGAACLARIEECVREHPDQWFAFDHLWEEARGV
ncbi:MAG: lysophospholipid acyltransferase family protein [Candidatus Krumholzibacteria bacterium]|nr:lysophospholipid acyltransferase family protein [Candidatus Krumholzibacteria bacterium]